MRSFFFCLSFATFLSFNPLAQASTAESYISSASAKSFMLFDAAIHNNCERINELIASGVDPNSVHYDKAGTALYQAVFEENLEAVKLLIRFGAKVNLINPRDCLTPLHAAVFNKDTEMVVLLLKHGARFAGSSKGGVTEWSSWKLTLRRTSFENILTIITRLKRSDLESANKLRKQVCLELNRQARDFLYFLENPLQKNERKHLESKGGFKWLIKKINNNHRRYKKVLEVFYG